MLKLIAASLAGALLVFTSSATSFDSRRAFADAPDLHAALQSAFVASAQAGQATTEGQDVESQSPLSPENKAARRARGSRVGTSKGPLYIPSDLTTHDGTFDVVIHFHGAPETVEPRYDDAGLNAVLYTLNLGIGSGAYETMFQDAKALDRTIAEIETVVRARVPSLAHARVGRVALSAWSAGYGAVVHVLSFPQAAERVDAVLLADGMHTGFVPGTKRANPLSMAPYFAFGQRAVAGEKLMAVTHSEIETPTYASTTRTAHELAQELALPSLEPLTPISPKLVMNERAERGDMHIFGFRGNDKSAHCQHLYFIGHNLFAYLGERWNRGTNLVSAR